MAQGLISLGDDLSQTAQGMGSTAVSLEGARNREAQMAQGAEKTQRVSATISGAAAGAAKGGAMGGPWGAVAGGFIGALAGLTGSKIF